MSDRLVYFVRHGATPANEQHPSVLQGSRIDADLSERGVRQAEQTRDYLRGLRLSAIFSSPMLRAKRTAEIIAEPHGLSVTTVEALHEVDVGAWEGLSYEEIAERYPEEFSRFLTDPAQHGYVGGETFADVARRVVPAIEQIVRTAPPGPLLVVWHNTVGRVYLSHVLGAGPSYARRLSLSNAGISVVQYRSGHPQVLAINSCTHLSPPPWWLDHG